MLQTSFGIATVAYLCLGAAASGAAGIAAASYIHSGARSAFAIKASLWTALASLLVGMGCLFVDLGRPLLALNISFFSNFTSWAARGFWLLLASLPVYTLLLIVVSRAPSKALASRWGFYRRNRNGIARALSWLTLLLSISLALYTGFLLYESFGVPFWRTPLLPTLFLCGSANIGLCLFLGIQSWHPSTRNPPRRRGLPGVRPATHATSARTATSTRPAAPAAVVALLAEAAVLALYLVWASASPVEAAAQSFARLAFGELSALFWLGIVLAGLLLPFFATLLGASQLGRRHAAAFATLALLGTAIGLAALRYGIVFSGITQY
ncbi:MAG: polysulfide reductase NrfD [Coriobacteriales bacterium]|nr:polysulfide reductase NrfD [Coriobacteriales bacterium]